VLIWREQTEAYYIAFVSDLAKRAASPSARYAAPGVRPRWSASRNRQEEVRVATVGCEAGDRQARQIRSL